MSRIELDRVSLTVPTPTGELRVLSDISLVLTEQRIALIGTNGSGKSALARLINGLAEPTRGAVRVDGLDVVVDGARVRRKVGFVFTDPVAQLVMPTVIEDVSLSLRRTHRDKALRRAAAMQVLRDYGLADLADRTVHGLSGGERQLLALAGVLATDPDVLVADEPTTLLDLRNGRMIGDLLLGLQQQLVIATHDLALAARTARVLLIDGGRVVADGEPADVIASYRRMCAAPA